MKTRSARGGVVGRVCVGLVVTVALVCVVLVGSHRPGSGIVEVTGDDPEMNAAKARAKETIDYFVAQVTAKPPNVEFFSVKKPYPTRSGSVEHIWIDVTRYADGVFYGEINNVPDDIEGIELGSHVEIRKDEITDWMFATSGREVTGGFTVRVLYDRATPQERARDFGGDMTFLDPP